MEERFGLYNVVLYDGCDSYCVHCILASDNKQAKKDIDKYLEDNELSIKALLVDWLYNMDKKQITSAIKNEEEFKILAEDKRQFTIERFMDMYL